MGTSSSNKGPKPNIPLLPDWSDSESDNDLANDQDTTETPESDNNDVKVKPNNEIPLTNNWAGAKRSLSAFSLSPTRGNFNRAASSYVRASGGAINAGKSAIHGKIVAGKVITFFNEVRQNGIGQTYENLGFGKISGDSIEEIFNNLAQSLSSNGGTDEETIARNAVIEALSLVYEDFDLDNNSIENLDQLTEQNIENYLEYYLTSYIYERWLHELGVKIEEKDISASEAVKVEREAFDFIQSSVSLNFEGYKLADFNYNSPQGKAIMDDIFYQAYTIIETL
jgi:hypothetical protein